MFQGWEITKEEGPVKIVRQEEMDGEYKKGKEEIEKWEEKEDKQTITKE